MIGEIKYMKPFLRAGIERKVKMEKPE